ncbi:unnamed protein product [Adineta steineri]|uniref:Replication factor C subunit 3 n=1 Tax=Adineta steineri TaxID=433720 RepID=A0A814FTH5_9BILA|nr:unnamed protein product [Adineta steineri]CAF3587529.1 unnamed protein product [Adineta steineri]
MSDTTVVQFSSPTTASIHSISPYHANDFEIKTDTNNDLPFLSKKKLIQFKPTHHDIFHSTNFTGPSFKQIIFFFIMFVVLTSLCSYLYKDSLINVLLILETLPWWWTSLFFCVLFALVSLPFAWGYILLNIACGFLYGFIYGVIFIIIYAGIGLSVSFYVCRFILTHNYCVIKNLKATFENSEIIQTIIKVLNSADGYKIIFLSRLTPIPLGLQNGFYSISNIPFRIYLFWSLCGLIPTQLIYCSLGSRLHSMTDLILIDKRTKTVGIVVGLCECFMTIILTYYVFHTAKKVLNKLLLETSGSNESLMMSLWCDKYRPRNFQELDYQFEQAKLLQTIVANGDFPHFLIFGPNGSGKKTRITCLLHALYGDGVQSLRLENHEYETPSRKKIEITTIGSNYHTQVNPSDVGIYDRVVIHELIKTIAQTKQINSIEQRSFKIIVIVEVDKLTRDAQHSLRRTMEKYVSSCRLILCCNSTSRVIPAIRSRCLGIRIAAPTTDEISIVLKKVAKLEGVELPIELANRIGEKSQRNLRRALLMLQTCATQKIPLTKDQQIIEPDWEIYLRDTARMISEQQTPQRIFEVRERLYELIAHCIPAEIIFKGLLEELLTNCDDVLKIQITQTAAEYEHRLRQGSKEIFHLEAFIAKFMCIYKQNIDSNSH